MLRSPIVATPKNSLCQFWKDSNQNCGPSTYSAKRGRAWPCIRSSSTCFRQPCSACIEKETRNRATRARVSELE
jgi:hypothetical protein